MEEHRVDEIGEVADTCDNLIHSAKLPLPPDLHLVALLANLRIIRDKLREIVAGEKGYDPWKGLK